jgi:hypothetical protein
MAVSASGEGLACWRRAIVASRLAWGLLNVGSPASSNSRRRSRAHGCIAGTALPPASGRGSRWLGSDVPPRNPSHRPAVDRLLKPPRRAAGWIFDHWERCGSGPSGTRRRAETWGSVRHVKHHAPGQSSSVASNHEGCSACPYGRCTVRRVGRDGCEVRSSGR